MTRKRWIYKNGEAIEVTADHAPEPRAEYHVMGDIQPYKSMVNGEWITSRSRHREHLREHGLSSNNEVGNDSSVLKARPQSKAPPPGLKEALVGAYRDVVERNRRR